MLSFICKDILDVVFYLDILFVGAAMFVVMVAGILVTDSCDVLFADSCDAKTCYWLVLYVCSKDMEAIGTAEHLLQEAEGQGATNGMLHGHQQCPLLC
jgi:hypothetical protein